MASRTLTTLRKHRRRHTLSQGDVAYLLGSMCGSKISRYEMAERIPNLRTALALSIVFDTSLNDLFPDLQAQVKDDIIRRAQRLLREMDVAGISEGARRHCLESLVEWPG